MTAMRVGLSLPQAGPHATSSAVRGFAASAEELGYGSLWVQERLLLPLRPSSRYAGVSDVVPAAYADFLAPTEVLAAAAAVTSRIAIGTGVLVAGYHRPVELAKRLATLDVLSEGRLVVGLGVGWSDDEHLVSDVDPRTRGRRAEELVHALLACWGPDPVAFEGEFFRIPPSRIGPKPVQRPHPPLLFGMSSRPGLERTARLADGWMPAGTGLRRVSAAVEELRMLRPAGLAPLSVHHRVFVEPPVATMRTLSVEQAAVICRDAAAAGVDEVIVELNFWAELGSEASWVDAPRRLLPVLEAAVG